MKKTYIFVLYLLLACCCLSCEHDMEMVATSISVVNQQVIHTATSTIVVCEFNTSATLEQVTLQYATGSDFQGHIAVPMNQESESTFSATIVGLQENMTYHTRYIASNRYSKVEVQYRGTFSLREGEITNLPVLMTSEPLDVTTNSALVGGNIINDGGSEILARGIVYNTSPNPTITNLNCIRCPCGSGSGKFTSQLSNLQEATTYYLRAYAKNENGTAYGEEVCFTTKESSDPSIQSFTVKGVSFNMIRVQGGTFTMGATAEQGSDAYNDEAPAHQVTLSNFYIAETEVTQSLWQAVMGSNPSNLIGKKLPVEMVSWDNCQEFIYKLNQLTGKNFRLPTEAEWEYAARGGNQSQGYKYAGSHTIDNVAWYKDFSGYSETTHFVKQKQANELGLYDMSGNVYEFCQDWYQFSYYTIIHQTNPTGPDTGSQRVIRGGSWDCIERGCRVSYRNGIAPTDAFTDVGLRLVL